MMMMMGRCTAVGMGFLLSPAPGALVRHLPLSESWDPREVTHPWVCGTENRCYAQGLSRRRVPGHLSHKKGTRRPVKVAEKV